MAWIVLPLAVEPLREVACLVHRWEILWAEYAHQRWPGRITVLMVKTLCGTPLLYLDFASRFLASPYCLRREDVNVTAVGLVGLRLAVAKPDLVGWRGISRGPFRATQ